MYTFYIGKIEKIEKIWNYSSPMVRKERCIILGHFKHYEKLLIVNIDVSVEDENIELNTERSFIRCIYTETDFKLKIEKDMMKNYYISVFNPDCPYYSAFGCFFKFDNPDRNNPLLVIAKEPTE